jgi:hypothetical protein
VSTADILSCCPPPVADRFLLAMPPPLACLTPAGHPGILANAGAVPR